MYFQYTIDAAADEPIMLINRHIGMDETDGCGIMGDQFQAELLALDGMGKKRIQVWINSVGGVVMDGYSIYNAILKSATKVDTYCVGIAASIAAVIFQAGRNRIMADYGVLMYHNPHGGDDTEGLAAMKESLVKMVAARSGSTDAAVSEMMDRTTWINAAEAKEAGLCDVVEASADQNKKRIASAGTATAAWRDANKIINKIFNKEAVITMKKVTNKLGLQSEASEDAIAGAIEVLQVQNKAYDQKIQDALAAQAKAESDLAEANNKVKKLQEEKAEAEETAKAEAVAVKKEKAKNLISGFVGEGRIKNDAGVIAQWEEKAEADFEGIKNLIEGLPINKSAANIVNAGSVKNEAELTSVVARKMAANRVK